MADTVLIPPGIAGLFPEEHVVLSDPTQNEFLRRAYFIFGPHRFAGPVRQPVYDFDPEDDYSVVHNMFSYFSWDDFDMRAAAVLLVNLFAADEAEIRSAAPFFFELTLRSDRYVPQLPLFLYHLNARRSAEAGEGDPPAGLAEPFSLRAWYIPEEIAAILEYVIRFETKFASEMARHDRETWKMLPRLRAWLEDEVRGAMSGR